MEPIRLRLPVPPSVNRLWRVTCRRGYPTLYKVPKAKHYAASVRELAYFIDPLCGDVAIEIHVYRPRKKGDLDNYQKLLLDSLNGVAFGDDKQVTEIHAYRHDDKKNPRAEVTVRPAFKHSNGLRLELARKHSMIRVRNTG